MGKCPPLILVSPSTEKKGAEFYDYSVSLSQAYPNAVLAAGGVPVIASCAPERSWIREAVMRCDGVMLTGGDDLEPKLYCENVPPNLAQTVGPTDGKRDLLELLILDEVFRQRKPLLAICRGHQLLNTALGGTLYIDIPQQLPNAINHTRLDQKDKLVHSISVKEGTILGKLLGKNGGRVNSSHHQAIDRVAKGLKITAWAEDGVIEGLEQEEALLPFLLSVQFHPERLSPRYPEFLDMFRRFTLACSDARSRSV
jgi:putative glutamine amidotransferase